MIYEYKKIIVNEYKTIINIIIKFWYNVYYFLYYNIIMFIIIIIIVIIWSMYTYVQYGVITKLIDSFSKSELS